MADDKTNPFGTTPDYGALDLFVERGRPGTKVFNGYSFDEFLPSLSSWPLRAKVYREMLTNDPIIWAMFHTVEILCKQANFDITAASDSPEDQKSAGFVKECLFEDLNQPFKETLAEWLTFIPWGWAVSEIVYKKRNGRQDGIVMSSQFSDGRIGIAKFAPRGQDTLLHWDFDPNGNVIGMTQLSPPDFKMVPIPFYAPGGLAKSLHFHTASNNGSPEGNAFLRHIFRAWMLKQREENLEGIGIERDLAGLPYAKIPAAYMSPNATTEQSAVYALFKDIVRNIRNDEQGGIVGASDVYPDSKVPMFEIGLLSAAGQKQYDVGATINRWNRIMLMVLLADFIVMGHERVGSFALADSKTELFADACGGFLDHICDQVNRHAIPTLLQLNGEAPDKMPKLTHGDIESVDPVELTQSMLNLANANVNIEPIAKQAINRMGYEVPEDAELMKPEPVAVPGFGDKQPLMDTKAKTNGKLKVSKKDAQVPEAVASGNGKK